MVLIIAAVVVADGWRGQEHVHDHAGFRVYIDGQLQDYRDYRYMNFTSCTEHEEKKSAEEEQIEKAHLHDGVGDVVHVHLAGAVWGDLLKNILVSLPIDVTINGYINGEKTENILSAPIGAYDTAIIMIGTGEASRAGETVPIEHIREVEAKSELCAS